MGRACSDDVRSAGSNFGKLRATFCDTPVITASNGTATTAAAGGPGACADFSACVSSALHASSCMHEAEPLAQGWMDFHKTEMAVCNYDPHKKQEPCRDLCQDAYRSKFNLPGNETVTNKCDYYRDFVFGQHRPAPCRATGFSGGPGMTRADNGNYGSNPAASYGSQYNGGSAGATHYNSNGNYGSNRGSKYGSKYGSDYDPASVVGSHGGQYSDTPLHDKLPGEHSAPTCLHNCFVHYAWKENLPRGEEPRCNLWSDYLFGDGCQEAHLK